MYIKGDDTFCFNPNFFYKSKEINILSVFEDDDFLKSDAEMNRQLLRQKELETQSSIVRVIQNGPILIDKLILNVRQCVAKYFRADESFILKQIDSLELQGYIYRSGNNNEIIHWKYS